MSGDPPLDWPTDPQEHTSAFGSLGPGNIHLWKIDLGDSWDQQELMPLLDAAERTQAQRFIFAADRKTYVASHAMMRRVLATYLAAAPGSVRYRFGHHGKPHLAGAHAESNLRFNLSHSGGLAVLALTRSSDVGVDVEMMRPERDLLGLAERYFSDREVADVRSTDPGTRLAAFYRCWTRKEAYIKARGDGLALPLDTFDVTIEPGVASALRRPAADDPPHRWHVAGFSPGEGFAGAFAIEGQPETIHGYGLTPET